MVDDVMEKKCPKCNCVKSFSEFYHNSTKKDGLTVWCKSCISTYSHQYHITHREQCRERLNKWRRNNREYVRERDRIYYHSNLELQHAKDRRYRETHKDKLSEKGKKYREKRMDYFLNKNRERRALKNSTSDGSITLEFEMELFKKQNGKCVYCGRDLSETGMHLDHIIPLSKGGTHTSTNVQWLCPYCNMSKHDKIIEKDVI